MINYHTTVYASLNEILPTHYELHLHSGLATPCISYMELSNVDADTGDTLGYCRLQFQIKVWGHDIAVLQQYAQQIDKAMRALGFKRVGANELYDNQSTMKQKILTYEALALERFEEDLE